MVIETTPWMIGGGATHDPAIARTLAYAALAGEQGIIRPTDLVVKAQTTPAGSVSVGTGAAVVVGNYPSQQSQSYITRNVGSANVAIPATSGAARADLIILRIDDPEFSGVVPTDIIAYEYAELERVSNVSSNATGAPASVTYPHIVLARVNVPGSTAAITNAMITDLREVAVPRTKRVVRTHAQVGGEEQILTQRDTYQAFPTTARWNIRIPEWATQVNILGHWNGLASDAAPGPSGEGETGGWLLVKMGSQSTQQTAYNRPRTGDDMRFSHTTADTISVPSSYRGTVQSFAFYGKQANALNVPSKARADHSTSFVLDVEFVEEPSVDS